MAKNPRWPTEMATNEPFQSGFPNGNKQNFLLDTFRIPNTYGGEKNTFFGGRWSDFPTKLITMLFVAVHWLILLFCRIMNEVPTFCSKFEWEEGEIVEREEGFIME